MKEVGPRGSIDLSIFTGKLIPFWDDREPVLLKLEDRYLLPVFSTKEKYDEAAIIGNFPDAKCKQIDDGIEFYESIEEFLKQQSIMFALDPHVTEDGNTRFTTILE